MFNVSLAGSIFSLYTCKDANLKTRFRANSSTSSTTLKQQNLTINYRTYLNFLSWQLRMCFLTLLVLIHKTKPKISA